MAVTLTGPAHNLATILAYCNLRAAAHPRIPATVSDIQRPRPQNRGCLLHGDPQRRSLLAKDVVVYVDGGGEVSAVLEPDAGLENVLSLFEKLAHVFGKKMSQLVRGGLINGLPGFIKIEPGNTLQTIAAD